MKKLCFLHLFFLGLSASSIIADTLHDLAYSLKRLNESAQKENAYKKQLQRINKLLAEDSLKYLDELIEQGFDSFFKNKEVFIQAKYTFPGLFKQAIADKVSRSVEALNENLTVLALLSWAAPELGEKLYQTSEGKIFLTALIKRPKLLSVILKCEDCVEALKSSDIDTFTLALQASALERGDWDSVDAFTIEQKINDLKFGL